MRIIEYILEVLICSGLFLMLYRWLLAGKVSYRICRAYIVGTMLLAAAIPALDVPLYPPSRPSATSGITIFQEGPMPGSRDLAYGFGEESIADLTDGTPPHTDAAGLSPDGSDAARNADGKTAVLKAATVLYCLTAAASIVLILLNIIRIRRLRRHSRLTRMRDWTLAESDRIQTPFSFLRTVYMGLSYTPSEHRMILTHEASHVRHRHSYERIVLSVLRSLLWFNPFLWMAEKDLREVQEWEADHDVLDKGNDLTLYRIAIFKQLFGYNPDISSGLNCSITKKRFIMMTKTQPGRHAAIRLAAVIPLLTATFFAFGCGIRVQTPQAPAQNISGTDTTCIKATPDAVIQNDSIIVINISKDGDVTVNGQESSTLEVRQFILGEKTPESTIRINFEDTSHQGVFTDIIDAVDSTRGVEYMIIEGNDEEHKVRIKFTSDTTSPASSQDFYIKIGSTRIPSVKDSVMTIDITAAGEKQASVTINGQRYDSDEEIDSVIHMNLSENLARADILISGDVRMGVVTDVKESLREAGVEKVYILYTADSGSDVQEIKVERSLPPALSITADSICVISTNRKYIHPIMVNSNDKIMMDGYQVTLEEIPQRAAAIIEEQGIRTDGTDGTDGPTTGCIFSIRNDRASSSELYVQIQKAIDEAYYTVRDKYARETFGKPLNDLTQDERAKVLTAIPMRLAEAEDIKYDEVPRQN